MNLKNISIKKNTFFLSKIFREKEVYNLFNICRTPFDLGGSEYGLADEQHGKKTNWEK